MTTQRNAGKTESRNRYILYLHKQKQADLCDFLDALPEGSVSSFLQDAVRTYILTRGHASTLKPLAPESAPVRRTLRNAAEKAQPSQTEPAPVKEAKQTHVHVWRWKRCPFQRPLPCLRKRG